MNNKLLALFSFLFLLSFSSAITQNFTSAEIDISVDVPANQEWAIISLSMSSLDFDDVNATKESDYYRIDINNSGNVNVTIKPRLEDSDDDIFENLYFAHRSPSLHSSYDQIGDWELNLSRTYNAGQVNKDYFYLKLYLKEYNPIVPFDIVNHQNTILFDIVPRYD